MQIIVEGVQFDVSPHSMLRLFGRLAVSEDVIEHEAVGREKFDTNEQYRLPSLVEAQGTSSMG